MKATPEADARTAALERARQHSIRVARLSADCWRVESSEPTLRGPYMVAILDAADDGACECPAGRFESLCHHRASVLAALAGTYPICDLAAIRGPAEAPASRRETRPERHAREIAEYDTVSVARRAAATLTRDDYAMFDYGE